MIIIAILALLTTCSLAGTPIELGKVAWLRDYDKALEQSQKLDKPVFILFQEVPGCSTCRQYGLDVLTHPFIVEAIEDNFVPLAVYNNKRGKDAAVLARYQEPSWNNPVTRIVDARGKMIANRISGNYSKLALVDAITQVLTKKGKSIPTYLRLFRDELIAESNVSEISLSMHCFWAGEKELGAFSGVVSTEAGYMDGREVVKVRYNEQATDAKSIIKKAAAKNCADAVYVRNGPYHQFAFKRIPVKDYSDYRKDKETKYYLYNHPLRQIPMTELQALKINRALATGGDPKEFLSPRQHRLFRAVSKQSSTPIKSRISEDFTRSWYELIGD